MNREQFCSPIKTRLRITANVTTDEGIGMGSKSFAKLSTNCWCWGIFFVIAWVRMVLVLTFVNFKAVYNILRFGFQSQIILNNSSKTHHFHTRGNIWNKRHVHYFFLAPVTVRNMVNAIHWMNLKPVPDREIVWCLTKKIRAPFYHIFSISANFCLFVFVAFTSPFRFLFFSIFFCLSLT